VTADPRDLLLELDWLESPTFGNFVADGNEEAVATLRKLASADGAGMAVVLWGPQDSAKTHLLEATAALAGERGMTVADPEAPDADDSDIVAVDDVHGMGVLTLAGQDALFRILDLNSARGRPAVLLTTKYVPRRLNMREDLRTRIGRCLVIALKRPDDDAKMRALVSYSARLGRELPEDVALYLMRREPRDMRNLLRSLASLDRFALRCRKELNVRTAREWFAQRPIPAVPRR